MPPRSEWPLLSPGWPHRDQLLARQHELIRRSAELRGELSAELRTGWQRVETPLNLALRLGELLGSARRSLGELRAQHPWLAATLVLWPPLLRMVWRRLRGRPARRDEAAAGSGAGSRTANERPSRAAQLLRLLRWARWAARCVRLLTAGSAGPSSRR
ncbi:MAG: hypothetical protein RLZZ584_545 [Pseudomonadota bacterium]